MLARYYRRGTEEFVKHTRLRHLASRSAPPPLDIQRLQAYFGLPRERYVREPMRAKRCNRNRSTDTNRSADHPPIYGRSSMHARFMGAVSLKRDRQSVLHGPSRASRFGGFFVAHARLGRTPKATNPEWPRGVRAADPDSAGANTMRRPDPYQERARELCLAAGIDPDSRVGEGVASRPGVCIAMPPARRSLRARPMRPRRSLRCCARRRSASRTRR